MSSTTNQAGTTAATWIVLENGEIRSFSLGQKSQWSIGRKTPQNNPDIPLTSPVAGRSHAELMCIHGEWVYIDKGSLNGSYHNEKRIANSQNKISQPVILQDGDVIRIDSKDLDAPDMRGVWMMYTTEKIGSKWFEFPLQNKECVRIGRDSSRCDIVLNLPYISAEHAKITNFNGTYYISDSGSLTGTWINRNQIDKPVALREKDKISLCDYNFIFTGDALIYNSIPANKGKSVHQGEVVLKADIATKKVPDNSGHGKKELIRDVHLEIKEGSLVALLGSSGAGKTTVMNCLNGMDREGVEGTVLFYGEDLFSNFERLKYLIGSVPQEEVFHPMLSVEEELKEAAIIRLPADTKRKEIKQHVDTAIAQLGLESVRKSKIHKCSGGEKKRVNIGIELVAERKILCLDEPDAGLDPGMKKELFLILRRLAHEEKKSILVIIHDVSDIELFDQIIMMAKVNNVGRLAFSGTPKEGEKYFGKSIKEAYGLLREHPEQYVKGV